MRIAIIGTGYVGLVAGACFADTGNTVYCVDQDEAKVNALRQGKIPIFEPGLEGLVKRGMSDQRLHFTSSTAEAVKECEIIFLAVGTPASETGEPDLRFLKAAAEQVGKAMDGYRLIVNKSTVPIGSHQVVAQWISAQTKHSVDVASNPEFLKEGSAIDDFLRPDRVIIGTEKEEVYRRLADLYAPFVRQGNPILWMDPISAEIAKYACNSFLAARISFMNELSVLCEKVGGDIEEVRRGMVSDSRIGKHFLFAGVGYGGSCFPKDIQALLATAKRENVSLGIITAAEEANERQKRWMVNKMTRHFGGRLSGKTIALWGVAFKPNTDDIREAPALVIIRNLIEAGAQVQVFDPVALPNVKSILGESVRYSASAYDALDGADALVLVTEWNEFRHPDFKRIKTALKQPVVFDGRNLYNPSQLRAEGFTYYGIGRRP